MGLFEGSAPRTGSGPTSSRKVSPTFSKIYHAPASRLCTTARPTTSKGKPYPGANCSPRRAQVYVRYREFEDASSRPNFCEISKPPDLGRTSNLSRTFPLTRTSSDTDRQDGYLSGLSAQARRHWRQAIASSSLFYHPSICVVGRC